MADIIRNNKSAVALFLKSLDDYESNLPVGYQEPSLFRQSSLSLHTALNRLITSSLPDVYQMMRELTYRILKNQNNHYDPASILKVSASSGSTLFSNEIQAIILTLMKVMNGRSVDLDTNWRSSVNSNKAVENFIKYYPTSDFVTLGKIQYGNIIYPTMKDLVPLYTEIHQLTIPLGKINHEISLSDNKPQIVSFSVDDDLVYPDGYQSVRQSAICGTVKITPSVGSFYLDRNIRFTDIVNQITKDMGCVNGNYTVGANTWIKVPAPFFSVLLDLFTTNHGQTWIIKNLQIVPPSLNQ